MTFDAFFHRDGGRYVPTELTRGPWSADAQHGGPPAALLGTILEATERRDDSIIVRATFELLMESGEAEGRRNWMREHWKTVEADV